MASRFATSQAALPQPEDASLPKSSQPLPTPETYTVAQTAHILGIAERTCYAAIDAGTIPSLRISNRILVLRVVVKALLDAGAFEPAEDAAW
jgi:hypothetical protein